MSVPTNIDAASATPIASLPFSVTLTQDDYAVSGAVALWWKYTAIAGDVAVGMRPEASENLGFVSPTIGVRTDPMGSDLVTTSLDGSDNILNAQYGLSPGTLYYFLFRAGPNVGDPGTVTMTLAVPPDLPAPIGSIVVPDDQPGQAAVVMDATTGATLRLVAFPANESAAQQADGTILTGVENPDNYVQKLSTYTADFQFITDIAVPSGGHGTQLLLAPRTGTPVWWVGNQQAGSVPVSVYKLSLTGAILATWPLPANLDGDYGYQSAALSPDGSLLYWRGKENNTPGVLGHEPIQKLDTATGVSTVFVAITEDVIPGEMITLANGHVVVAYRPRTGGPDFLRHYDASGVQVGTTYTTASDVVLDHLIPGPNDPADVLVWLQNSGGRAVTSTFRRLNISDWSLAQPDITRAIFELGVASRATADEFGPSASCPIFLTTTALVPDEPPPEPPPIDTDGTCVTAPVALTCAGTSVTAIACAVGATVTALGCGGLSLGTIGLIGEGRP